MVQAPFGQPAWYGRTQWSSASDLGASTRPRLGTEGPLPVLVDLAYGGSSNSDTTAMAAVNLEDTPPPAGER